MKKLTPVLLLFVLGACATSTENSDYRTIASLSVPSTDTKQGKQTLVVPKTISPKAVVALVETGAKVVSIEDVPYSDRETLPRGYAMMRSFEVSSDQAKFEFTLGPIPRPKPGEMMMSCGTTYRLTFKRVSSKWERQPDWSAAC